jgi:hypothetical protein
MMSSLDIIKPHAIEARLRKLCKYESLRNTTLAGAQHVFSLNSLSYTHADKQWKVGKRIAAATSRP